jgi:hypothetical protein
MSGQAPFRLLLQVRAAVEATPSEAAQGEPLSYALWEMAAPTTSDPDPRPLSLLRAYHPSDTPASRHLNATV